MKSLIDEYIFRDALDHELIYSDLLYDLEMAGDDEDLIQQAINRFESTGDSLTWQESKEIYRLYNIML